MTDLPECRDGLARSMEQRGAWPERSPWLRAAVTALPRDLFAPARLWRWDGRAYVPVDRGVDSAGWIGELYRDQDAAAVTQVTAGLPTCSLSAQAVVVDMLDSLLLEPGHRVLDLGTGAGWNAALAAWRAGPKRVTTVEVDPALAEAARASLQAAGLDVACEVANGTTGLPGGRFDRIIATYAVERIPFAWVESCVPGGRIVTPWGRLGHVALTVADDGASASGWVQGLAQFMPDRSEPGAGPDFAQVRGDAPADTARPLHRDLTALRADWNLRFAARVAAPDVRITTALDEDGTSAWLHDGAASWAVLSAAAGGPGTVHQGGPRRLADELENAWQQWEQLGGPTPYDYGMTVRPDGQFVWLNDPDTGPRWPAAPEHQQARALQSG
ncbi:methyltransferase domain-containing protein [Kitasatospora sp. NPDC050463]|uniref:methyltransferase domain-containing protein n=1 Tax=Kitasatospora sp. NPDC050463 TaxID=3155786 RepID=UPI0033C2A6FA